MQIQVIVKRILMQQSSSLHVFLITKLSFDRPLKANVHEDVLVVLRVIDRPMKHVVNYAFVDAPKVSQLFTLLDRAIYLDLQLLFV